MQDLATLAAEAAKRLTERGETVAIAESSTGGLISAALLGIAGASAYFRGGAIVYTQYSREGLLAITAEDMAGIRASSEPYARLMAARAKARMAADWALSETGATGPSGNRYGDAPGHSCMAVAGPAERVITLETGSNDRAANMRTFARRALELLIEALDAA